MESHVTPCFRRHAGGKFHTSHTTNSTLEFIINWRLNVDPTGALDVLWNCYYSLRPYKRNKGGALRVKVLQIPSHRCDKQNCRVVHSNMILIAFEHIWKLLIVSFGTLSLRVSHVVNGCSQRYGMCACVCAGLRMHVRMFVHMHVYAHACLCARMFMRMHVYAHACLCTRMFTHTHVYACMLRPISLPTGPAHCRQAVPELDEGGKVPGANAENRSPSHQEG